MNYIKKNDLLTGAMNEELIQLEFKEKFNIDLIKTGEFDIMDFTNEDKTLYVEIKSRTFNYKKYDTTMIGENKLIFARKSGKECIFIFSFTDGNYYYRYDKNDYYKSQYTGRTDRGYKEYKEHIFIPINMLKPLNTLYIAV